MSDGTLFALATYAHALSTYYYYLITQRKKKPRKRRFWMIKMHANRIKNDEGNNLLADLKHEPSGQFENFCRMSSSDFEYLLNKVGPVIAKKDTRWRKALPIKVRLAVTLRFLATGDTYKSLHFLFRISSQIISKIIPEVCNAIINALHSEVKWPSTTEEWLQKASKFQERGHFPHCLGALDGKHVRLQSPIHSGSEYYNYKHYFSIVLLAVVDSDYSFMYVDVGCQGRISDGGVFNNSTLKEKIHASENYPSDRCLPGRTTTCPFVFLADNAFALSNRIMKPFPGNPPNGSKTSVFNKKLSGSRVVVENAFGIMSSVFRVFRVPMLLQPEQAKVVTLTCIYLHNFLLRSKTSSSMYSPDIEHSELRQDTLMQQEQQANAFRPISRVPVRPPTAAINVRNEFADFLYQQSQIPELLHCTLSD